MVLEELERASFVQLGKKTGTTFGPVIPGMERKEGEYNEKDPGRIVCTYSGSRAERVR